MILNKKTLEEITPQQAYNLRDNEKIVINDKELQIMTLRLLEKIKDYQTDNYTFLKALEEETDNLYPIKDQLIALDKEIRKL
jgi:hypothetical protein